MGYADWSAADKKAFMDDAFRAVWLRLKAAFEENVLRVEIDFAHDVVAEPPPLGITT